MLKSTGCINYESWKQRVVFSQWVFDDASSCLFWGVPGDHSTFWVQSWKCFCQLLMLNYEKRVIPGFESAHPWMISINIILVTDVLFLKKQIKLERWTDHQIPLFRPFILSRTVSFSLMKLLFIYLKIFAEKLSVSVCWVTSLWNNNCLQCFLLKFRVIWISRIDFLEHLIGFVSNTPYLFAMTPSLTWLGAPWQA